MLALKQSTSCSAGCSAAHAFRNVELSLQECIFFPHGAVSLSKTSTTTSETKPAQFFGRPDSFLSGKYYVLIIAIMGIKLYTEYPVQASSRAAETFEEQVGAQYTEAGYSMQNLSTMQTFEMTIAKTLTALRNRQGNIFQMQKRQRHVGVHPRARKSQ